MKIKFIKSISFFIIVLISLYSFIYQINIFNLNNTKEIEISIDGIKYKTLLGKQIKDINIDIDSYDENYVFGNKEEIFLNKNKDRISINRGDINELIKLPGIGIKTALKIIEYREKFGNFSSIEEIKNVSGIGDKKYEKIKELISV